MVGHYRDIAIGIIAVFCLMACTEEIAFETETVESALVIEAIITNENLQHTVKLSRAFEFGGEAQPEENASVEIISSQEVLPFTENNPGEYISSTNFAAVDGVNYQLKITLSNGTVYESEQTVLTSSNRVTNLQADRVNTTTDIPNLGIFLDGIGEATNGNYFRYTFEETYKIRSPYYNTFDIIIAEDNWPICRAALVQKTEQKQICYNTLDSKTIVQASTAGLSSNSVTRVPIHAVSADNYILGQRYSILVKQYTVTSDSYIYYDNLLRFQENPMLFSQVQPGYLRGNINSVENPDEIVVGFFDIAYVSSARIFTNYLDFFPDREPPSHVTRCEITAPAIYEIEYGYPIFGYEDCLELITTTLPRGEHVFYQNNDDQLFFDLDPFFFPIEGPYDLVPIECGDCTLFGTNIAPEFWEE